MRCSSCSKKAIIKIRYLNKAFCPSCLKESIEKRVYNYIREQELFKEGEKVVVGVSGGKDSLSTLYLLNRLKEKFGIEVEALTIDEGIEGYRPETLEYVRKQAEEWDIEHKVFSFKQEFGYTLDEMKKKMPEKWTVCHYCGVFRRYLLNKKARELGADKLATGHNLDDEAQSVLMNCFMGDVKRMNRLGAKSGFLESDLLVRRVKPIRLISERETTAYALVNDIETSFIECPYISGSFRAFIRDLLNQFEFENPGTKLNLVKGIENLSFEKEKGFEMKRCKRCGEPTSQQVCNACKLLEKLGDEKGRES